MIDSVANETIQGYFPIVPPLLYLSTYPCVELFRPEVFYRLKMLHIKIATVAFGNLAMTYSITFPFTLTPFPLYTTCMYLRLPGLFLHFWYLEAPVSLFLYFFSLNNAAIHMLSIPLFLRTFFRPLKNEYRGDLVAFSLGMGIIIKIPLILAGLFFMTTLILFELLFYLLFLSLPVLPVLAVFLTI